MRKGSLVVLMVLSFPAVAVDYATYGKAAASVVRVIAKIPNTPSTSLGSGVILPDGRIATNCHVIPGAGKVVVMEGAAAIEGERGPSDLLADLCLLNSATASAPRARMDPAQPLQVGDEVVAIGFGGGVGRNFSTGHVTALHPYRNGRVIQTTAAFRPGASGGGLFDRHGNLVGITTFFRRNGTQSAYFAIPVEWLDGLTALAAAPDTSPFWMLAQGEQPLFLQVATYEADSKWTEMEAAARRWTLEEPDQPQPWEALNRALGH